MRSSRMNVALRLEDPGVVVIEADDHAAPDLQPRLLHRADALDDASPPLCTFWYFFVSRSDSSLGLSMPMKTLMMLASTISSHQLVVLGQVERRLGEEGERDTRWPPARRRRRAAAASIAFLLPIRLSSTMKTISICCLRSRFQLGDHLRAASSAAAGGRR